MISIGIDPGKFGGIVALDEKREVLLLEVMPEDMMDLYRMLRKFKDENSFVTVFLEEAHPRPNNGLKATHTFAFHNGQIEMILRILRMSYELTSPVVWGRVMHACATADNPKDRSRLVVKRLFPDVRLINPNNPRARSMHLGLMDALLIAEYGLRKLGNANTSLVSQL